MIDISKTSNTPWDTIIQPRSKWVSVDLKSVFYYRSLIWMFFKRDFITFYKQTILGPLWYLIQPTLSALTYFIVFGKIAKLSTDGLPPFVFYMSGIVIWSYFASCLINNGEIFSKNSQLFSKVYFPRLVVPLAVVMSGMVAFCIQFLLLISVALGFLLTGNDIQIHWLNLFFIPLFVLYVASLGMGVGLIVSALTVRFRDLAFATSFITQLWMFATPIVYPLSKVPPTYQKFFYFNPMSAPVESLRSMIFGTSSVQSSLWFSNLAITASLLIVGLILFTRAESNAMDTV
jgi:lipopolysaccharide transport system permease protein